MKSILEQRSVSRSSALNEILLDHLRQIDAHAWPGIDGLTLDVVLASYVRLAVAGHVPGKDDLLCQHRELANELESLFSQAPPATSRPADPAISPLFFEHTD